MGESALLLAVTEDSHCLAFHELVHEDADNVAVTVTNILALTINIVWAKNHIVEAKHFVRNLQLSFDRELGDAIGVLRHGDHIFGHGRLSGAVNSDGGSEDEAAHLILDCSVDQIDGTNQIIVVVETFNEVTQSLSGIGRKVIYVIEIVAVEEAID